MTASLLKQHLAKCGKKGGLSKSKAKRAAARKSLAKARTARWKGRGK